MNLKSQEMRKLAPELDPLRIGSGWKEEDLEKPQILIESTFGDSHPGSVHLNTLVKEVRKGVQAQISVTERAREPMGSITASPAGRSLQI